MRYYTTPAFNRSLHALSEVQKERIKKAIQQAVAFFETGDLRHGLGFKVLRHGFWEIRAGLSDRVIFRRNKDMIEFVLVGSHDEIKRFLKHV